VVYVRYLSTAVQRLSRTSRYYPEGILKSSIHPVHFGVRPLYYSHSTVVLSISGRQVGDHHTSALQDRGVHPLILAYVRSRSPISQNALLANPSDPKSKLTLSLSHLCLVKYLGHYSISTRPSVRPSQKAKLPFKYS
jgi:hypothetical protein